MRASSIETLIQSVRTSEYHGEFQELIVLSIMTRVCVNMYKSLPWHGRLHDLYILSYIRPITPPHILLAERISTRLPCSIQ